MDRNVETNVSTASPTTGALELDDHLLADIGVSRQHQALQENRKPLWK